MLYIVTATDDNLSDYVSLIILHTVTLDVSTKSSAAGLRSVIISEFVQFD